MTIRIGILGYGNLGRGVEAAIAKNPDMELKAVFTRRAPENLHIATAGAKVLHADQAEAMKDEIDVLMICGGSATDLPAVQQPHQNGFDRIVVMVAEGDLAASALLRFGIQVAAAHFSTQKAGMPGRVPPCDAQYIRAENFERQRQPGGVLLQLGAALRGIARIHSEKAQRKIDRVLQILQQEGEQHGVLSPGNAHRDAVARLHERIVAHRAHKGLAQRVPEFVLQGVPDLVCVHRPFFLCWKW